MSFIGYKVTHNIIASGTWMSAYNAEERNDRHPETSFEIMDDARLKDDWTPNAANLAGPACMALMNNGLLEMLQGTDCQSAQPPVCEHRSKYN
jgi:hypothetical protein